MSVVSGSDSSSESVMRRAEKPSFAQTCSMLSQYLKENKASFGDLSLAITSNSEGIVERSGRQGVATTRNFLQNVELSGEAPQFSHHNIKSMDLFPQKSGFGVQDLPNKSDVRAKMAPEPAQLTIFYEGKVFVFDNLTAEKANEVMLLASKASSPNVVNNQMGSAQEPPQRPPQAIPTDLPIARKASLQRFLEKRKDRISTRAPYQFNTSSANTTSQAKISSSPLESNKSWLDMAPQARNPLELQL